MVECLEAEMIEKFFAGKSFNQKENVHPYNIYFNDFNKYSVLGAL